MRDVALEVPLAAFALTRLLQGHDSGPARIEVLHEPLDGAALAGGVAALEQMISRSPVALIQYWSFSSSICSWYFSSS